MPETRELREILSELHAALDGARDLDVSARAALEGAVDEIRDALGDQPGGFSADAFSSSLRGRLSDALSSFGKSHPRITEVVRRLVDQLADLGI